MRLSNRINHIVNMCSYTNTIIDIGCDHGYISIELVNRGKCKKCYAVDINEKPLLSAIENISKYNLDNSIECILSNGFDYFDDLNNISAVIAGMGGSTIVNILKNSSNKINNMNYILIQPNAYSRDIRRFVYSKNIYVKNEDVIYSDGIYYEYILISPKQQEFLTKQERKFLLDFDYEIPLCVLKNNNGIYDNFIQFKLNKYIEILRNIRNSNRETYNIKCNILLNRINILEGFFYEDN